MRAPRLNALVTLSSGHQVYFLGLLAEGRMRVKSKKMLIEFETDSSRLPYIPW
ncbi:hypothetical protein [Hymenobacter ruber]